MIHEMGFSPWDYRTWDLTGERLINLSFNVHRRLFTICEIGPRPCEDKYLKFYEGLWPTTQYVLDNYNFVNVFTTFWWIEGLPNIETWFTLASLDLTLGLHCFAWVIRHWEIHVYVSQYVLINYNLVRNKANISPSSGLCVLSTLYVD